MPHLFCKTCYYHLKGVRESKVNMQLGILELLRYTEINTHQGCLFTALVTLLNNHIKIKIRYKISMLLSSTETIRLFGQLPMKQLIQLNNQSRHCMKNKLSYQTQKIILIFENSFATSLLSFLLYLLLSIFLILHCFFPFLKITNVCF